MGVISPTIVQQGLLNQSSAAVIDGSLVFDGDNHYLTKTFASAGNRRTFTFSFWVKRSEFGITNMGIFSEYPGSGNGEYIRFSDDNSGDTFRFFSTQLSNQSLVTNRKFRDTGWYHICVAVDTTEATNTNRVKIYINSERNVDWASATWPSQDAEYDFMNATAHYIGRCQSGTYLPGSLSQFYVIDGLSLGPSYFGFTDPLTNTWRPKAFKAEGTTVNDGTVWSSGATNGSPYSGSYTWTTAFNGNPMNSNGATESGTSENPYNIALPNIPFSSLTLYTQFGGDNGIWVNGIGVDCSGNVSLGSGADSQTVGMISFTAEQLGFGVLNQIGVNGQNRWFGLAVDGVLMVDNTTQILDYGVNGFYLPMDGNTPIGLDQSGRHFGYSNVMFSGSGAWHNDTFTPHNAFDGTPESGTYCEATSDTITWAPVGLSWQTSLEVMCASANMSAALDGGGSVSLTADTWTTVSGSADSIDTSLIISRSGSANSGIKGIRLDGVILVDGSGSGWDSTNDWTPVNFGGSNVIPKATGALPILNTLNGGNEATVGVRTDADANNLILALPLVGNALDVSNQINSGSTTKVASVSGATADTSVSNFYGGCFNFDGSNDKITIAPTNASDFTCQNDFTIEGWIYVDAFTTADAAIFSNWDSGDNRSLLIGPDASGADDWVFMYNTDGTGSGWVTVANPDATPYLKKWTHIAYSYDHSTTTHRAFVDGVLVGSSSAGTAYNNSGANLLLGINKGDGSGYFDGKMQDVRYYHAVKYTSDFIPASTDPDILPDTPSGVSLGSQLAKVPVTDGSVYFDGTSDSLTFETSSDLSLDGDFTIEFWAYPDSIAGDPQGSDPSPITMPTDGSSITQVFIWANNLQYTLHKSTAIVSTANGTAATKRWQHVAFTRSGTTVYAFFDGVLQNTATSSATFGGTSGTFQIASYTEVKGNYDGYLSNLRIIKGTALYTSNFTPPTRALTNVTNTKLLCCQSKILAGAATVSPSVTGSINDGVVWSEQSTITPPASGFNSGGEIQFAFDGLITTLTSGAGSNTTFFIINFAKPITVSTSLEVYMSSGSSEFAVNGGSYAVQNSGAWRDLSFTGTLTHLSVRGDTAQTHGNNAPRLSAIRIDGSTILTDPMTRVGDTAASTSNPFTDNINTVMGQETDYATLNPLYRTGSYSDGNLVQTTTAGNGHYRANIAINESSGKWYFEYQPTGSDVPGMVGLVEQDHPRTSNLNGATAYSYYGTTGHKQGSPSSVDTAYGATFTFGDVIGVAFDTDNGGSLEYFKNGASQGVAFSNEFPTKTAAKNNFPNFPYFPAFSAGSSVNVTTYNVNFGQKPFKYVPPEGFQPLNYANLQSPGVVRPDQYVGVTTYPGGGSTPYTISGYKFSPDLVWVKERNGTRSNIVFDTVRGVLEPLYTDTTDEQLTAPTSLSSFNPDGFTVGTDYHLNQSSSYDYVGWCWKAGGSKNTFNVDGVGYASASDVNMSVGALNSSEYLQDAVYSSTDYMYGYSPAHGAQFGASQPATNAFNGVIGDAWDESAGPSGAGAGVLVRFTPPSQVASNKVEVFVNYYNDISFYTGSPTGTNTKVAGPFTNTISRYFTLVDCGIVPAWDYMQIEVPSGVGNMGMYFGGIKIGGKLLVDSNVTPPNVPSIAATGASVGTKQGFSITKQTSSSTSGGPMTIAHGLSQKPDFIIGKDMDNANTFWAVYHSSLGGTKKIELNSPDAAAANANYWSNIDPTSSVVYSNSASWMYTSASFIMYSWHNVPGLQKFGLYSGIDSTDGIFLELGFRPAIIMFKNITDGSTEWVILDDKRNGYNNGNQILFPSDSAVENSTQYGDFVSNGFKFRINSGYVNASGDEYIYAAWAHQPMNNLYGGQSNAR